MDLKDMKTPEAVEWLLEQWASHNDGDENQNHALATEMTPGFIAPTDLQQARGHLLKDNNLDVKYPSFWDIPFGKYATVFGGNGGWRDVPLPDIMPGYGYLCELYVTGEHANRKTYFLVETNNGSIYYIHSSAKGGGGNNNSTEWKRIDQTTLLAKGSFTVGDKIPLKVSTRRFRELKIGLTGIYTQEVKIVSAVDNPVFQWSNVTNAPDSATFAIGECQLTGDSEHTTLTFERCKTVNASSNEFTVSNNDKGVTIKYIEGVF
uniref:Uncharacterized protein n=1 Tax=Enterococcus phage vB_EFS_EFP6 TaxID=3158834 RepID=A0AAU7L281_9CAUD